MFVCLNHSGLFFSLFPKFLYGVVGVWLVVVTFWQCAPSPNWDLRIACVCLPPILPRLPMPPRMMQQLLLVPARSCFPQSRGFRFQRVDPRRLPFRAWRCHSPWARRRPFRPWRKPRDGSLPGVPIRAGFQQRWQRESLERPTGINNRIIVEWSSTIKKNWNFRFRWLKEIHHVRRIQPKSITINNNN